jgi:small subunit ribosomal protein S17
MADSPETPEEETSEATPAPEAQSASGSGGEAAASGASASDADAASEPAVSGRASEPVEVLPPKERRRRHRAVKAAAVPVRPSRSAEERQAEREAERARKGRIRSARRKSEREKAKARRSATPEPLAEMREKHPGLQKTRQGIVVSDGASKTIVVRIDVTRRHPFYGKVVRTSTTLHAHDEAEDAHVGDTVVVRESRPLSRTKRWRLVEVLERAK